MSSIKLRASCPESVGNELLGAYAKDSTGIFSGVAVVARITEVTQERTRTEDGTDSLKRVGIGTCLDALYIGPNRIWE